MKTDIFLKIDGVKGESQDATYKEEIDISNWSWGARQSGTSHVGLGSGSGKVAVQDITLSKHVDKSSPALFVFCCAGKHIPKVKIICRKAGDKPLEFYSLELEDVIITNITVNASSSSDNISESLTINFRKFKITYKEQKKDGSGGSPIEQGWDISANKAA